jgi:hypothetical protein
VDAVPGVLPTRPHSQTLLTPAPCFKSHTHHLGVAFQAVCSSSPCALITFPAANPSRVPDFIIHLGNSALYRLIVHHSMTCWVATFSYVFRDDQAAVVTVLVGLAAPFMVAADACDQRYDDQRSLRLCVSDTSRRSGGSAPSIQRPRADLDLFFLRAIATCASLNWIPSAMRSCTDELQQDNNQWYFGAFDSALLFAEIYRKALILVN